MGAALRIISSYLGRISEALRHGMNREHIGGAQADRGAKRPLDQRGYLDQVEAADQFLGFHKGTVENGALSLRYAYAYTLNFVATAFSPMNDVSQNSSRPISTGCMSNPRCAAILNLLWARG